MCGIIGYFGTFTEQAMRAGMCAMAHRGPDDHGLFTDASAGVGLGQQRLSIIDLSPLGHQPMQDDAGLVQLIFNGEIYNYRELRTELQAAGARFRGHSDTEVILQMYLKHGASMLPRLNGIFTIALWDTRTRTMLVARDALGVKPLYIFESKRGLAFCSEIKGLLHLVPEARTLDHAALHRYLSFLWCPGEGTPLAGVRKLLPGEALELREAKVTKRWTWYQLPMFRGARPDLTEQQSLEGTVKHLRAAVERQMVADVPVGAFLSGGLDSSSIVAFAREQNPDLRCFTIEAAGGQDEGTTDDLPYAQRVAKHLNVKLDVVRINADRMAGDLERMIVQLDEPLADPAPLNVLYISQLARDNGMKVLLSGAGGDDLFTGYRRHRAVNAERLWSWMPRPARHALDATTRRLDQRRAWSRRLAKLFSGAGLERDQRIANYFVWSREADLLKLYTPEFRRHLGTAMATEPMTQFLAPLPPGTPALERMLALEQRFFLADHNLIYTDKMSMAVGVEVRVPFLDLELVDFAARIPLSVRQRGKEGKWVLKRAMEPYLPHDVIYRPKSGFGAPLRRWMQNDLRPLVADLLGADSLRRRGLFDPVAVNQLVQANQAGKVDANYTLLSLLSIEIWCRHYLDRAPAAVAPARAGAV
ncbi:MAG: asparagine synthase (glutamine-hydrolyzing) [Phycisphaerales bacterium]